MRDLAAEQGISYSLFRHTFKQHSGLSPKAYLIELRIERARSLLTGTSLSVKEVADQLSFETPYYFMRLFKNKTGMTPTQWRTYSRGRRRIRAEEAPEALRPNRNRWRSTMRKDDARHIGR